MNNLYYRWCAEWMPISIHLAAEVIDGLNQAIRVSLQANPGRGTEVGGILLGRVRYPDGSRARVSIEGFEPVESEHRRGASYVPSEKDRKVLGRKLARARDRGEALQPVGFYRSHTRRGLYLDNEDFSLFRTYFPEPYAPFLLVRPVPGASSVAGFFIWEEGEMRRESTYQEFPFDRARLPLVNVPVPVAEPRPPVEAPAIHTTSPWPSWDIEFPQWRLAAGSVAALLAVAFGIYEGQKLLGMRVRRSPRVESARVEPLRKAPPVETGGQAQPPFAPVVDVKPSPFGAKPEINRKGSASRAIPNSRGTAVAGPEAAGRAPDAPATRLTLPPPPADYEPASLTAAPPLLASLPAHVERMPERLRRPSIASVTIEPAPSSKVKRFVGRIPGFRRLDKSREGFVPPRPIRQFAPPVPPDMSGPVPVDVRVTVDRTGNVSGVEVSKSHDRHLIKLAADAAQRWRFEPARLNDESVTSEMILHFTFR